MLTLYRSLVAMMTCLAICPNAFAQTLPIASPTAPPMTSNRPGISESEALLVPRSFQVELGMAFSEFSDALMRHQVVDLPEATIRFGVTPRVELFANVSNWFVDHRTFGDVSGDVSGAGDTSINAKLAWLSEGQHPINLNVAAGLSLPVGSDDFSSGGYDPSLRLLWSRSLPRDFAVSGNLDIASVTVGDDRLVASAASLGLGHSLTARSSWFVELFGDFVDGDAQWQFDGGVAIVTSDDFQIDLSAGRTLQSGPAAWFVAAGITIRHRR
jgi:hypothetical protein